MLRQVILSLFGRAGYQLMRNEQPIYANAAATEACIANVAANTMQTRARLISLADQVAFCVRSGIQGDFVECGVWKGGGVGLMAGILLSEGAGDRKLHLFDSFTDICPPDPEVDGVRANKEVASYVQSVGTELKPMDGVYDDIGGHGTIAECRRLIVDVIGYPADQLEFHEGWFQETLPKATDAISQIALLRLDGDWYASTKVCLEYLFDKVVPGGIIVIDDYAAYEGCSKAVDEFLEERGIRAFITRVDNACYFFLKSA